MNSEPLKECLGKEGFLVDSRENPDMVFLNAKHQMKTSLCPQAKIKLFLKYNNRYFAEVELSDYMMFKPALMNIIHWRSELDFLCSSYYQEHNQDWFIGNFLESLQILSVFPRVERILISKATNFAQEIAILKADLAQAAMPPVAPNTLFQTKKENFLNECFTTVESENFVRIGLRRAPSDFFVSALDTAEETKLVLNDWIHLKLERGGHPRTLQIYLSAVSDSFSWCQDKIKHLRKIGQIIKKTRRTERAALHNDLLAALEILRELGQHGMTLKKIFGFNLTKEELLLCLYVLRFLSHPPSEDFRQHYEKDSLKIMEQLLDLDNFTNLMSQNEKYQVIAREIELTQFQVNEITAKFARVATGQIDAWVNLGNQV